MSKILFVLGFVGLLISLYFNYKKTTNVSVLQEENNRLLKVVHDKDLALNQIERNFVIQSKANCLRLPKDIALSDRDNNKSKISDQLIDQQRYVLFIPSNACHACFDSSIEELRSFFQKYQSEIIIITEGKRIRETISFLLDKKLNIRVFGIEDPLGISIEAGFVPFFFVLQQDLTCKDFFILDSSSPTLLKYYLKVITGDLIL